MSFHAKAARFYVTTPEGSVVPFTEVPNKSKGGTRRPTIADAREAKAVPSVTSILQVLSKPSLDAWKMRKVAEAALTLPRLPGESDEEFIARIAEDAFEEAGEAADLGTRIHDDIAQWLSSKYMGAIAPLPPLDASQYTQDCKRWLTENVTEVLAVEKAVAYSLFEYAGRMDLCCLTSGGVPAIVDYKSQRVKRNAKGEPKPAFYSEYPLQLSSYALAFGMSNAKLVSIIIDTAEPGPCFVKDWTEEHTCSYYFDIFSKALDLWKYINEW